MFTHVVPIEDAVIYERDVFADVTLLEACLKLLKNRGLKLVTLPEGRGAARLLNLLQWDLGSAVEYVDGDGPYADQVVHYGAHHMMDRRVGSHCGEAMLLGEVLASATDLYLLGKLIQNGRECDFLVDTLESFGDYYHQYGDEAQLEQLLASCGTQPFETMAEVVGFLYTAIEPLLYLEGETQVAEQLLIFQENRLYPLLHHYNIGNWVLTIRSRYPKPNRKWDAATSMRVLLADEASFLELFRIE